ncbi:MAG: hypothetical protein LBI79_02575 [Nitrososphaerota archaeon]|jgi:hypothetical protein|nr:hypothetical protein [Nitrososphaerota archaeon]
MSEMLRRICHHFTEKEYPELVLKNSELFGLIKNEHYQGNLMAHLFPIERTGVPPLTMQALTRTLASAFSWFEKTVLSGAFDEAYKTDWDGKINNLVIQINGPNRLRTLETDLSIRCSVVFWVVFYSVLRILSDTGEIADYCELKGVI